jgi:hypothetical protein
LTVQNDFTLSEYSEIRKKKKTKEKRSKEKLRPNKGHSHSIS